MMNHFMKSFVRVSMVLLTIMICLSSRENAFAIQKDTETTKIITLHQAMFSALNHNPDLAASLLEIKAAEGDKIQEGLIPNPEIEFEVEEFGGTGELSGFDSAGYSMGVSHTIELGGKRAKRKRVAKLKLELARWDYKAGQMDVIAETYKAYTELLGAQKKFELADESYDLAKQVMDIVAEQVKAGKVSPLEKTRAEVELSTIRIEKDNSMRELNSARKNLAAMWGSTDPDFDYAAGEIEDILDLQPVEEFIASLAKNPDIARWETEMDLKKAELSLEKTARLTDLSVSGKVLDLKDISSSAYAMGISMDLPIFDRNQGGIKAAESAFGKAHMEKKASTVKIETRITVTYNEVISAHFEAMSLKNDVLPSAQKVFDATQEGYRYGKFDFLEVIDSQRTLIEVKRQFIDALVSYHSLLADLNRLTGKYLMFEDETDNIILQGEKNED